LMLFFMLITQYRNSFYEKRSPNLVVFLL
jgi:hypothetical protein